MNYTCIIKVDKTCKNLAISLVFTLCGVKCCQLKDYQLYRFMIRRIGVSIQIMGNSSSTRIREYFWVNFISKYLIQI